MRLGALLLLLILLLFGLYLRYSDKIKYHMALSMPFTSNCTAKPDRKMVILINELNQLGIPGGQISFASPGQGTINCAFGWGGSDGLLSQVSEEDIFRYASLAKIFTSLTAIKLAEQETIELNSLMLPLLKQDITPLDPRVANITLSHLLRHRAGFDRKISGDPMLSDFPWCPNDLSMLSHIRLNFSPGDEYSYSNLGYCLVGAALSKTTKEPLADIINQILHFNEYKTIQRVPRLASLDNEATYFFENPETEEQLLRFNYPAMLASGGWAGTAADLATLLHRQFNTNNSQHTVDRGFEADCDISVWRKCHGLVFYKYQQAQHHVMYWRDGSLPGISAFAAISQDGDTIVILANYRKYHWLQFNDAIGNLVYRYLDN